MIGGANANVLALYHFYLQQDISGTSPKLVIFAAGRPPYLQNQPEDLSEGSVMAGKFLRKIASVGFSPPEILILSQNRNTQDDMNKSLAVAHERGLNNLAFVTIAVQIRRADAFLRKLLSENQGWEGLNYTFISAEKILSGVDDRYRAAFQDIEKTTPYRNNVYYETRGLIAFGDGKY